MSGADQPVNPQRKIEAKRADTRTGTGARKAARHLQTVPGIGLIGASADLGAAGSCDAKSGRGLSAGPALTPGAALERWQGQAGPHPQDGQQVAPMMTALWFTRSNVSVLACPMCRLCFRWSSRYLVDQSQSTVANCAFGGCGSTCESPSQQTAQDF
jgi:hypothetical protein